MVMAPGGAAGGKKKKKKAVVKGEQANEAGAPTSATSGNSTAAGGDDAADAEGNTAAAATENFEPLVGDGQKMIEIFQVCVRNCGGRKLSSVYGEVSLRTAYGQLKIFSRPKERPEPLGPFGGFLTLVGPEYEMSGYDSLELCLDLWEGEEQVISGYSDLEARNDAQYNCPLCEVIEGSKGKAVVYYAVFFNRACGQCGNEVHQG